MNEKEYKLTYKINNELLKLKKRLNLVKLEEDMCQNSDVIRLKNEINIRTSKIEDLLHYLSEESKEVKEVIKEISELKIELSNIKEVKKYNKAIKKYNEYIDYINKEIFNI